MFVTRTRLLAALAAALLCGCTLNAQPTPVVIVVTSSATEAVPQNVIAAATATAEPTAIPTPTTPPDVALQSGDRFLLNGRFEDAVAMYQAVLDQGDSVEPALRGAAAFALGQAAVREGLFERAVTVLTAFLDGFPQDERVPQAYFMRGDAYLGLSRWNEAIADFQAYLEQRPGLVDSYAHERIADARLALGQTDDALTHYALAAAANRTTVSHLALRERVAQVYASVGQPAQALEQYEAILAVARNAPYRAQIELAAAQTALDAGDIENGLTRMQRVFETYPGQPEAYSALTTLIANGREIDPLQHGRVAFSYGDYQGALEVLNAFTTQRPLSAIPAEVHLLLGRSYREIGNPSAAVVAFQTIIDQYPQDPAFGEALLEQGRTKFLAGDIPGAIEEYLRIADTYGYLPEAPEALWRAGYLYGTNDQPQQSQAVFERLADAYPDTEQARSGLFLAASAAVNSGNEAAAEVLYGRLAVSTTGEDQASAYLTAGRLALQRGDARAEEMLRRAADAVPDSYYSARAQDLLDGRAPFAPPAGYRFQFDDAADIAAAEDWLRQTFGIEQSGALWPLSAELEADPRWVRGRELWTLGVFDSARAEFSDLAEAMKADGLASYQLAVALRAMGAYQNAIVCAANVLRQAGVGTLDAPPFLARMRYPAYYADLVLAAAEQRSMDPLLLLSLIRHESLFDTYATAAAGEKGLTQVIPSTAEYIATQLGWPDYQHADLFRPYAGIAFGAFFLDEQLERFDGNVVAALAGYNAGPGRAQSWLALSGGDPDLFMTAITINSTRTYVERIYSYFNIYRALYGVN